MSVIGLEKKMVCCVSCYACEIVVKYIYNPMICVGFGFGFVT